MIERIIPKRDTVELPNDVAGLTAVIDSLDKLHPDDSGHGPAILNKIKSSVERLAVSPEEGEALRRVFDDKLSELLLKVMDAFPNRVERAKKGFNAADRKGHEGLLGIILKFEIPQLPFFSEERRAALVVKAQQKIWSKGFIPKRDEKDNE